jgi:hypothetical protein
MEVPVAHGGWHCDAGGWHCDAAAAAMLIRTGILRTICSESGGWLREFPAPQNRWVASGRAINQVDGTEGGVVLSGEGLA